MQIQITEAKKTETGAIVFATCGKVSGQVWIRGNVISVVCQNAAHKVWRGMGKTFYSVNDALANYRSGEMKAIIGAAVDYSTMAAGQVAH